MAGRALRFFRDGLLRVRESIHAFMARLADQLPMGGSFQVVMIQVLFMTGQAGIDIRGGNKIGVIFGGLHGKQDTTIKEEQQDDYETEKKAFHSHGDVFQGAGLATSRVTK